MKKSIFRILALSATIFATEAAVAEQALTQHFGDGNSCYARKYSDAHLAKHPNQTVAYIRFDHFPSFYGNSKYDPKTGELVFKISAKFRDSNENFWESGWCHPENGMQTCGIECDGGGFDIKSKDADSILLYTKPYGFAVAGCGSDTIRVITPKTDDKVFLLHRLPQSQCVPPNPNNGG